MCKHKDKILAGLAWVGTTGMVGLIMYVMLESISAW